MAKTISVSDDRYIQLDALRLEYKGSDRKESFDVMFARILSDLKKVRT